VSFREEAPVYASHVWALLWPGRTVQHHSVLPTELATVGDLAGWSDEEVDLLINESRRALDEQHRRFDRIRATAQVLLPTATALFVVLGSELSNVQDEQSVRVRWLMYFVWAIGSGLVLLAALGAAAVMSVRSDFGAVFPTLVSQSPPPIRKEVARAYAKATLAGEITVATRLTVIRDAVTLLALGGVVHVALWLVRVL
jgi:hypothetical protein